MIGHEDSVDSTFIGRLIGIVVAIITVAAVLTPVILEIEDEDDGKEDMYVFMITGQSNSAYRNANVSVVNDEVEKIPFGSAYYIGTSERPPASKPSDWQTQIANWGMYSMNNPDGSWHIGNYEPELASIFYQTTGKKCLIINAGWDSASINACQPGEYLNTYVKAMFNKAMSLIPDVYNVKIGCIFWSQGEADDTMTINEYKSKFIRMWNDYRRTMGWDAILMAQTKYDQSPITPTAQEQLDGIDHIYLATKITQTFTIENGLMGNDNQHYSQKGRILVAEDWMNYYLSNEYSESPPITNSSFKTIIGVIPILVVMGLIIGVFSLFYDRQNYQY